MTGSTTTTATAWALALMLGAGITGWSQGAQGQQQHMQQAPAQQGMPMQPGMMGRGMGQEMGPGMMGQGEMGPGMTGRTGMWHMGPHMMSPDEMHEMMEHMGHMMGQGMGPGMMGQMRPGMMGEEMGPGMMGEEMGPGMMGQMGPGLMGPGMGPRMGGLSGLEGRRVVPMVQLSTDDVRGFLERHLEALGNERLKVGTVEALDDDTITAEIVTLDDSLVERFEVDRHTGLISAAG